MKNYTAVVERCPDTGLYVGYVPGFPGAHSQGKTLDELNSNLREAIEMLLEEGEPELETQFIGAQTIRGVVTIRRKMGYIVAPVGLVTETALLARNPVQLPSCCNLTVDDRGLCFGEPV
jgi:predicted RNase H-like HicB family nuclease